MQNHQLAIFVNYSLVEEMCTGNKLAILVVSVVDVIYFWFCVDSNRNT